MRILSIDIGWLNMGLALATCKSSTDVDIEYVKKVNLDDYKYIYSNEVIDLIPLFIDDHRFIFDSADVILIERQPPGGFGNIQTLIHYMCKDRVVLISPNSLHSHFGMNNLDYGGRKVRSEQIASRFLREPIPYERKHDITDAILMILYYNFRKNVHIFDQYRYDIKEHFSS